MEIQVKGHSGCIIEIENDGIHLFINKSTNDKKYIERLYNQAIKQQNAYSNNYKYFRIPEVFEINKSIDYLCLKMEYIYSKNFIDYFEDAGFEQIDYFVNALKFYIDSEIDKCNNEVIESNIVVNKFEDVCDKILQNSYICDDSEIINIIEKIKPVFNELPDKLLLPIGICHGDLTFSNILFNGNNYYLIDFLDSFLESPLLDIVKIRQDSKHGWSQLLYKHKYDELRLSIIYNKIDTEINDYYNLKYKWYRDYYSIFETLNFLRILQYANEKNIIDYLKNILIKLI